MPIRTPPTDAPSADVVRAELLAPFVRDDVMAMEGAAFDRMLRHPEAFASMMDDDEDGDGCPYELDGGLATLSVRGALAQRGGRFWCWSWPGYDTLAADLSRALADERVRTVALVIDSPGGVVAGLFDAVRAMRAAVEASGKRVVAISDERCFSAAYALACVADEIIVPETGGAGSVGVMGGMTSYAKALAAAGIDSRVYASGAEKADGHPALPITKEADARTQRMVDEFGAIFRRWVADRRKMTPEAVQALEAGVRYGAAAVSAGLADRMQPAASALAGLRASASNAPPAPPPPMGAQVAGDALAAAVAETADPLAALSTLAAADAAAPALAPDLPAAPAASAPEPLTSTITPEPTMTLASSSPVLAALGAQSESDGLTAVTALVDARKVVRAMTGATTDAEAHGILEAWKRDAGALVALRAEVTAERATRDAADRRALLEEGVRDKKITPAEASADGTAEAWTTALATPALRSFMASRKGIVAPPPAPPADKKGAGALTDAQKAIADQMGIAHAEYAQHLAAQSAGDE